MTVRLAAWVSVVLGLAILGLYLDEVGKAPWSSAASRHLRHMKDRTAQPAGYQPMRLEAFEALPRSAPLASYAAIERRAVVTEGYVQRMQRVSDGDFHLDFAPSLDPDGRLVPFIAAEVAPDWHRRSRTWTFERFVEAFRPYYGGPIRWDGPPRRARLSGWLMYDYPYEGSKVVPGFPPHLSYWEIHPVTRIEIWDDSLAAFVEIPR